MCIEDSHVGSEHKRRRGQKVVLLMRPGTESLPWEKGEGCANYMPERVGGGGMWRVRGEIDAHVS